MNTSIACNKKTKAIRKKENLEGLMENERKMGKCRVIQLTFVLDSGNVYPVFRCFSIYLTMEF